jgi:serine/threonine protein kinase
MNPQGIFPGNGDADESGPLVQTPFATLDMESGRISQRVIPDYELLRRVGRGSYGEVFLARNLTGSFVAVKVVARSTFDHDRPFDREFEGIKSFEPVSRSDPRQVAILHVGRGDGFFYYAMELADDWTTECAARDAQLYCPHTLREDLKRRGHLPVSECVEIGLALARALEHLHHHGLVHRDVKPSNVIFVASVPKLADIGLMTSIDSTRSLVGTDGYAAPEGPGTPQADLYSLGKLLYEISTGCDRKQFPTLPPDITDRPDRDALIELNAIFTRACQFDPSDRYATAEAMLAELELVQRGRSVKDKRTYRRRLALAKKIAVASAAIGLCSVAGRFALRQHPEGAHSTNPEAQILYDQAVFRLHIENREQTFQAFTNLSQAVSLDPDFADAYYKLFEIYMSGEWYDQLPAHKEGNYHWVLENLKRLRPNSPEYHAVKSWIEFLDWNFDRAVAEAHLALKLNPRFLRAHIFYGWYMLLFRGDAETARREMETAERIDGADVPSQTYLGQSYYFNRNFAKAIEVYQQALRLESRGMSAHHFLGRAYEAAGLYSQALEQYEAHEKSFSGAPEQIEAKYRRYRTNLTNGGPAEMWRAMLQDQTQDVPPDHYVMARSSARLGDTDHALSFLEMAYQERNESMVKLLFDDCWDAMRDNPRFRELVRKMGFSKVRQPEN